MDALEYKTYYDIRFEKAPNQKKILKALEDVVEKKRCARALNTLAEYNQVLADKKEGSKEEAAKYYNMSAEEGCQIGIHWMGIFYY